MLGAVAIGYFFAAALVMALACSGPDVRAKFASAYLMCSWGLTNLISMSRPPEVALLDFSPYDFAALLGFLFVMALWPARWIALMLASLSVQIISQAAYGLSGPGGRSIVASHAVNEAMWVLQLIAPTIPTIAMVQRRARRFFGARPTRKVKIPPPYPGWEPPDHDPRNA